MFSPIEELEEISNIYFLKDMTNFIKETHKKGYKMGYGIPTLLLLLFYVDLTTQSFQAIDKKLSEKHDSFF